MQIWEPYYYDTEKYYFKRDKQYGVGSGDERKNYIWPGELLADSVTGPIYYKGIRVQDGYSYYLFQAETPAAKSLPKLETAERDEKTGLHYKGYTQPMYAVEIVGTGKMSGWFDSVDKALTVEISGIENQMNAIKGLVSLMNWIAVTMSDKTAVHA